MQINYILLAHKNPYQLKRLIEMLSASETFFYVHIDKNVSIDMFVEATRNITNVYFIEDRKETIWGDIGIVIATVNALRQVLKDGRKGYCILLSGQDYPIQSNKQIKSFLETNYNNEYIDIFPMPTKYWPSEGKNRIEKYKFNLSSKRGDYIIISSIFEADFYTIKTLKKIFRLIKIGRYDFILVMLKRRRFPKFIKPYGGSQWWALSNETIKEIINFIDKFPGYLKYHKYSLIPDEMFFQSIFMHVAENKTISPTLTYANWEKKNCEVPVTFTISDFEELKGQANFKMYARKFDLDSDEEILNLLDKNKNASRF